MLYFTLICSYVLYSAPKGQLVILRISTSYSALSLLRRGFSTSDTPNFSYVEWAIV